MPNPSATPPILKALAVLATLIPLTACAPLIIGGGAAIVADEIVEQEEGGDGLF